LRNFKCRKCKETNTLGAWNKNSKDSYGKLVLHEMKDDDTFQHLLYRVQFTCPTCSVRSIATEIDEVTT
jgi:hypothetical protein